MGGFSRKRLVSPRPGFGALFSLFSSWFCSGIEPAQMASGVSGRTGTGTGPGGGGVGGRLWSGGARAPPELHGQSCCMKRKTFQSDSNRFRQKWAFGDPHIPGLFTAGTEPQTRSRSASVARFWEAAELTCLKESPRKIPLTLGPHEPQRNRGAPHARGSHAGLYTRAGPRADFGHESSGDPDGSVHSGSTEPLSHLKPQTVEQTGVPLPVLR